MNTGRVAIGGFRVQRLALGAMRLLSTSFDRDGRHYESWGLPEDPDASRAVMQAAVNELGIEYVDFARGYGPHPDAGEGYFRSWMAPYAPELLWATKVGYHRDSEGGWIVDLAPESIAAEIAKSRAVLGAPVPLMYLVCGSTSDVVVRNRPARLADALAPLVEAQKRGDVRHIGLANVGAAELEELSAVARIDAVQNKFTVASLAEPGPRAVLESCRERGIAFVAWGIFQNDGPDPWVPSRELARAAETLGVTPQEASIAILLHAAPNLVTLTGASRRRSLESSVKAAHLTVPSSIVERFV